VGSLGGVSDDVGRVMLGVGKGIIDGMFVMLRKKEELLLRHEIK
jgi:hypothetical protein